LDEDPYYAVSSAGDQQQVVRISRLAQLINRPELVAEYRDPGHVGTM
jgi:hypothetical protein